ncbi:MAG: DUF4411 family protein [Proteobacteria bacterium]|nr:DUF4411 family protein [Pseudomonadota bacterium]MBU1640980.1 DUF4411 family protein [Pseudomonadota bacterium]
MYLLDANVLIDSNRDYYPLSRVPEFWEWLLYYGQQGQVKIPIEIYEEIKDGNDDLAAWMKQEDVKNALLLNEDVGVATVADVIDQGYAPDLTDDEVEKIGRDPFLVAHALHQSVPRCVVTTEISKPSKQRANRKLPDVCRGVSVRTCNTFQFIRELDFSTNWNKP